MTAAKDPLDQLSELPLERFESIGPLERSDHGPFLTIKPPRVEGSPAAPPLPDAPTKASHMTRRHHAWVIYPMVACYDPGPFVEGVQIARATPGPSGRAPKDDALREPTRIVEHYRLSALAGWTFPRPLWCTVRSGPWYGTFVEQESCTAGDNVHKWDFYLEGVQEPPPVVSWFGGIGDMPTVPQLSVVWGTLVSENPRWSPCRGTGFPDPVDPPA